MEFLYFSKEETDFQKRELVLGRKAEIRAQTSNCEANKQLWLSFKLQIGVFAGHVLNRELWWKPIGLYVQQVTPVPAQPFLGTVPSSYS